MAEPSARIGASDLLIRALDGLSDSATSASRVASVTESMHKEIREFVRQDADFHATSVVQMAQIGKAIEHLSAQIQRAQDREDRREEARISERAETRGWIYRAAAALWAMPELRMLLVLLLAGWLGIKADLIRVQP